MLPGVGKIKKQLDAANLDDVQVKRQIAVIRSMTKAERKKPDVLNASRRRRIAKGAGVDVAEVNKVLKMHRNMADMVKSMGKGKMPAAMAAMGSQQGPGGGGMGGMRMPSPEQMKAMQAKMTSGGGLPGLPGGLPNPLAGLPGGLPGLPGVKKKD
jgi:signal recognition particle subunit SRP54